MNARTPTARKRSASPASRVAGAPIVAPETARPDRRQAILLAAEKLFAQHGYHAVTIRQIAEEAGVPLALVGYYFGPKHELFHAIFEHWSHTIEERLARLAAVTIDPDDARTLPRIIEAFTAPVLALRASTEGEYYALLVARELYHATEEADRVLRGYFDPLAEAYIDALHVALPHATRSQVAWGYQFALGALLHHLNDSRIERLSRGENTRADPAVAPMLVNFIVGGLRAALPKPKATSKAPAAKSPRTKKTIPRRPQP
jgi:AcrR family transcriptional regulator